MLMYLRLGMVVCEHVYQRGGWSEGEEQKAEENTEHTNQFKLVWIHLQCWKNGVYEVRLFIVVEGNGLKSSGQF